MFGNARWAIREGKRLKDGCLYLRDYYKEGEKKS
jgi:hypothetical protein